MRQVDSLGQVRRIQMYGDADDRDAPMTGMWLFEQVTRIAENLVQKQQQNIQQSASRPPSHLNT